MMYCNIYAWLFRDYWCVIISWLLMRDYFVIIDAWLLRDYWCVITSSLLMRDYFVINDAWLFHDYWCLITSWLSMRDYFVITDAWLFSDYWSVIISFTDVLRRQHRTSFRAIQDLTKDKVQLFYGLRSRPSPSQKRNRERSSWNIYIISNVTCKNWRKNVLLSTRKLRLRTRVYIINSYSANLSRIWADNLPKTWNSYQYISYLI